MSEPPREPPREGVPLVAPVPPVDIPADPNRAAADAAREAERANIEAAQANLEAIINCFNTHYNLNGGPPLRDSPRLISPNSRRLGNPPLPPRVLGGGPVQGPAHGEGQAHQPGLVQQLNGRDADGGVARPHVNSNPDANTKESKYEVFDDLSADIKDLAVYNPTQNETTFQKMR